MVMAVVAGLTATCVMVGLDPTIHAVPRDQTTPVNAKDL